MDRGVVLANQNPRLTRLRQPRSVRGDRESRIGSSWVSMIGVQVHYLCEWDEKKNALKPSEVTAGSNVKVWWRCSQGHSYLQAVASKRRGCSCPKCANVVRAEAVRLARLVRTGNLKDQHPSIAELWHATKNHPLQPTDISSNSHRVIWWSCTAGHEWRQSANHLVIRSREIKSTQCCPVCLKRSRGRS